MVKVAVAGEPWESNRVLENQKASELLMNVFIDLLEAGYRKVFSEICCEICHFMSLQKS